MNKDTDSRNCLKLIYLHSGIEYEELICLPEFNWRKGNHASFIDQAERLIADKAKQLNLEKYDWTFACVPIDENSCKDGKYLYHFILSHLTEKVGRYNQAFDILFNKIKAKETRALVYFFYDMEIYKNYNNFWLLPDGSIIGVGSGSHRSLVEHILKQKECDLEKIWVKVQNNTIFYHDNMTAEQYVFLDKIKKDAIYRTNNSQLEGN